MTRAWRTVLAVLPLALLLAAGCSRGGADRPASEPRTASEPMASGAPGAAPSAAPAPAADAPPGGAAPAAEPAPSSTSGGAAPAAGDRPRTAITLEKVGPAARPPARPASERTPLLSLERDGRLMPEDFRIGPLQDTLQAAGPALGVSRVVEKFLGELVRGRIDAGLIEPESREALSLSLGWYLEDGFVPDRYRIGQVEREEGAEARCRVRLFRGEGSTDGEFYLSESGGTWYIADVQIGLDLLGEPPEAGGERFAPPGPGYGPSP